MSQIEADVAALRAEIATLRAPAASATAVPARPTETSGMSQEDIDRMSAGMDDRLSDMKPAWK